MNNIDMNMFAKILSVIKTMKDDPFNKDQKNLMSDASKCNAKLYENYSTYNEDEKEALNTLSDILEKTKGGKTTEQESIDETCGYIDDMIETVYYLDSQIGFTEAELRDIDQTTEDTECRIDELYRNYDLRPSVFRIAKVIAEMIHIMIEEKGYDGNDRYF